MAKKNRQRALLLLVLLSQLGLILFIAGRWLVSPTQRFYLEDRVDDATHGTAWQKFPVENGQVVPQIVTRNDAHISFPLNLKRKSTLRFNVVPVGPAGYSIYLIRDRVRRSLVTSDLAAPSSGSVTLPAGQGILEIENRGAVTWFDLRSVPHLNIFPAVLALIFLVFVTIFLSRRGVPVPGLFYQVALSLCSLVLALAMFEFAANRIGNKLPFAVIDARRDLGVFRSDPRWENSPRYNRRLRPNTDTMSQWEYGDLVQTAFIPPEVAPGGINRYRIKTDAEGFRNEFTRDSIDIAALGDSFTDGLAGPIEQSWPSQLQARLGLSVQNYGTSGFGPQQELYVLRDYVIHHHPRVIVVAYYAGNDLFDAEAFEQFEQHASGSTFEGPGWKIKKVVPRYQTLYTYTLIHMALRGAWKHSEQVASIRAVNTPVRASGETAGPQGRPASPSFDRGMFVVPVNGHSLHFAFTPAYLRTLNYSRHWLEARRGWALTRETYREMKRTADDNNSKLVVMFVPFKSQVYLPLLQRSFTADQINRDFQFYFRENATDADVAQMTKNRLAQNEMMASLCQELGIPFLDLTPVLEQTVEQGGSPYIPDDAHLNALGYQLAAGKLTELLQQRSLLAANH